MAEHDGQQAHNQQRQSASPTGQEQVPSEAALPLNPMLAQQRTIGNQAVQRMIQSGTLPASLILGQQQTLGNQGVQRLLRAGTGGHQPASGRPPIGGVRGSSIVIQRQIPENLDWQHGNNKILLTKDNTLWRIVGEGTANIGFGSNKKPKKFYYLRPETDTTDTTTRPAGQPPDIKVFADNALYIVAELNRLLELRQQQQVASLGYSKTIFGVGGYSFEGWFEYLWKEYSEHKGVNSADKRVLYEWTRAYRQLPGAPTPTGYTLDDAGKLQVLTQMLNSPAFMGFEEGAMVETSRALEKEQKADQGYPQALPSLTGTQLGYRSDSRDPATIERHRGSRPRTRMDRLAMEMNLHKPWNPFTDERKRRQLFLRLGASSDNDLNTVVSVAVDPRDAVKFPLPKDETGGPVIPDDTDRRNLYVVWVPSVLDTSREVETRTKQSVFGRGELGAADIPYQAHLVHIVTRRLYKKGDVTYVAGKVEAVHLLQPDDVYLNLPRATRDGLFQLVRTLNNVSGGALPDLGWLVHGTPQQDARHQAIADEIAHDPIRLQDASLDNRVAGLQAQHQGQGLFVDYPYQGERIHAARYSMRIFAPPGVHGVQVKIDGGTPLPTRVADTGGERYYWHDIDWSGYSTGEHRIQAIGLKPDGHALVSPERTVHVDTTTTTEPIIEYPRIGEIISWPDYEVKVETDPSISDVNVAADSGTVEKRGHVRHEGKLYWQFHWKDYQAGDRQLNGEVIKADGGKLRLNPRVVRYRAGVLSPMEGDEITRKSSADRYTIRVESGAGVTITQVTVDSGTIAPPRQGDNEQLYDWSGYDIGTRTIRVEGQHGSSPFVLVRQVTVKHG